MRTGGECGEDCESTVHSSVVRGAATRNKGTVPSQTGFGKPAMNPMIRDQLFATGTPGTLKGGLTQRHARPMQDKVVM